MRKIALSLAVALSLCAGSARGAGPSAAFGPWVEEASRLLQAADQGFADLERLAEDPKSGLGPRNPQSVPFRSSLILQRSVMDRLAVTLAARDPEFFALLDQGSVTLGGLRVAWARTGVRNDAVTAALRLASASYRLLRSTYGLEGLRHRQGGALSEAERRQFQRLQRSQRRLAANLERLRDQARRRKDSATAAELDRFRAEAALIAWAPLDLDSYLNALIATSEMRGEWRADSPYVKKLAPRQDWAAADQTVEELWVDADIGKVFMVDLGKPGDEASPAQEESPAEAEGAVQLYQAVEDDAGAQAEEVTGPAAEGGPAEEFQEIEESEAEPELEELQAAGEDARVEEEDLAEAEAPEADSVLADPLSGEAAAKPAADPAAGKEGSAPAAVKKPKEPKDSGPAKAQAAPAQAAPHPKPPGIG